MGDWNTLHHFDDKTFYSKIVTDLRNEGQLLRQYFNSEPGKYIVYGTDRNEERIAKIIEFCQSLDPDFKRHPSLLAIQKRQKGIHENYTDYVQKRGKDETDFYREYAEVIEDLNHILTVMVFSECAAFNPHLILGRSIFTGCVAAKPKSVAENIISIFPENEPGSVFYSSRSNCSGLINWVTGEEVKLLWLDRENLHPVSKETEKYFSDFYTFLEIAVENGLGFISGTNMNESMLKLVQSPLSIDIDVKALGLESVINYE